MNQELNVSIELATVASVFVLGAETPVVLDEALLAQIAGGVTSGPNGGW